MESRLCLLVVAPSDTISIGAEGGKGIMLVSCTLGTVVVVGVVGVIQEALALAFVIDTVADALERESVNRAWCLGLPGCAAGWFWFVWVYGNNGYIFDLSSSSLSSWWFAFDACRRRESELRSTRGK